MHVNSYKKISNIYIFCNFWINSFCLRIIIHYILYTQLSHWAHCKKEPNWRYSFSIARCGEWNSNNRENYTDLSLPSLTLSFVGVNAQKKKGSSVHQILFQIMLDGMSVSWEKWGTEKRVRGKKKKEKNGKVEKKIKVIVSSYKYNSVKTFQFWFPDRKNLYGWHLGTLNCRKYPW